jgi:glycosyltransferase involved in cell wall biosynthesis
MKISVIIPTFNSSKYITDAINSVLIQKQADEIIFVDDDSTDNTVEIINKFMQLHPDRIKLYISKPNAGAGVTRNLGIQNAKNEIIAFLDSDDFYLPDRFDNAIRILSENPNIDGVYECIGTHYEDETGKELHLKRMSYIPIQNKNEHLTTLTRVVAPENLYEALVCGGIGWFHFNGLTLRKSTLNKSGFLLPELRYGQDTEFFFRLARKTKLISGQLDEPVAMRRVYATNGTLGHYHDPVRKKLNKKYNGMLWKIQFENMLTQKYHKKTNRFILNRYIDNYDNRLKFWKISFKRKFYKLLVFCYLMIIFPKLIFKLS